MTTHKRHATADQYPGITYVIPCGGAKATERARARDMYRGSLYRHALTNVTRLAAMDEADGNPARVLILSAKYGLLQLDEEIEPYDLIMGRPGSVTADALTAQALGLGIDWGSAVYAFLPRAYLAQLDTALRTLDVYVQDVYEACTGNGDQRRVLSIVGRPDTAPAKPDGPGPVVWIGGDVNAFTWGQRILVNYVRLRESQSLPVALTPWVLDSNGYAELDKHGRWTITAEQYAADIQRYADEIGKLEWVAPQDWPARTHLLAKTGLTEEEHQRRTCESVVQLRGLLGGTVPVVEVVTGETVAGYLRHIDLYREYGIDLRASRHVIGVGALVGRSPAEAADIIRSLHAAGLTRLHGFGLKTRVLDLVGPLLESIDSSAWSREARNRFGPCPHGLVKWERNCPLYAQEWGERQHTRGARAAVQEVLPLFDLGVAA